MRQLSDSELGHHLVRFYNPLTTRTALPSTADRPLNKVLPHFLIEVGKYNILGFTTREHGTGTLENLRNIRQ